MDGAKSVVVRTVPGSPRQQERVAVPAVPDPSGLTTVVGVATACAVVAGDVLAAYVGTPVVFQIIGLMGSEVVRALATFTWLAAKGAFTESGHLGTCGC